MLPMNHSGEFSSSVAWERIQSHFCSWLTKWLHIHFFFFFFSANEDWNSEMSFTLFESEILVYFCRASHDWKNGTGLKGKLQLREQSATLWMFWANWCCGMSSVSKLLHLTNPFCHGAAFCIFHCWFLIRSFFSSFSVPGSVSRNKICLQGFMRVN